MKFRRIPRLQILLDFRQFCGKTYSQPCGAGVVAQARTHLTIRSSLIACNRDGIVSVIEPPPMNHKAFTFEVPFSITDISHSVWGRKYKAIKKRTYM